MRGVKGTGPFSKANKATGAKGRGRASAPTTGEVKGRARKHLGGGQTASGGNQRAENEVKPKVENGVTIDVMPMPGRGGRPQEAEKYPFSTLDVSDEKDGTLNGPSFLIVDGDNPDNVLAAARKRHKTKTFASRKMEGGVRIWRRK